MGRSKNYKSKYFFAPLKSKGFYCQNQIRGDRRSCEKDSEFLAAVYPFRRRPLGAADRAQSRRRDYNALAGRSYLRHLVPAASHARRRRAAVCISLPSAPDRKAVKENGKVDSGTVCRYGGGGKRVEEKDRRA